MPRVMWIAPLVGMGVALAVSLTHTINVGLASGFSAGLFMILAGTTVWGPQGVLIGFGVGSVLRAPKWAVPGALLACIPFACLFALSNAQVPPGHPSRGEEHWFWGVQIFAMPASCGAGLGACTVLLLHKKAKIGLGVP
jgi:hypothetical protein